MITKIESYDKLNKDYELGTWACDCIPDGMLVGHTNCSDIYMDVQTVDEIAAILHAYRQHTWQRYKIKNYHSGHRNGSLVVNYTFETFHLIVTVLTGAVGALKKVSNGKCHFQLEERSTKVTERVVCSFE